jgi:hypothetical protein
MEGYTKTEIIATVPSGNLHIFLLGKPISFIKVNPKQIYLELINKKFRTPSAQKRISEKLVYLDIEWKIVYNCIYKTTIDTSLHWFQYRILLTCCSETYYILLCTMLASIVEF